MPHAHLFLFSDASGGDWLAEGRDEMWHTVANYLFQSDPALQPQIDQGASHEDILTRDTQYVQLLVSLQARLPSGKLRKWSSGTEYKKTFCKAFAEIQSDYKPIISACSFQEKTLRASKNGLLNSYNRRIGGVEGRGIKFAQSHNRRKKPSRTHSFVNFHGHHKVEATEDEMLPLLLMSWFAADQYSFYLNEIVERGRYGFDGLSITIVSDKLSNDGTSEERLRNLIDPEGNGIPITVKRSAKSDTFSGDLLVDNLAGWLNDSLIFPSGEYANVAKALAPTNIWNGWHELLPDASLLKSQPAILRLTNAVPA